MLDERIRDYTARTRTNMSTRMSNGDGKPHDGGVFLYDVMFNHNWYRNGNAVGGLACTPRPHFFCGGFVHVVIVAVTETVVVVVIVVVGGIVL